MSPTRNPEHLPLAAADPLAPRVAAYGTWHSPISGGLAASSALRLSRPALDGDDIYWLEGRPAEGGRSVVVKRDAAGRIADVTPPSTNVRTRVHEYGGGAYVVADGIVYYSEFADQRVYRLRPGGTPEPITPPGDWCYADGCPDPVRPRLVLVREDHTVSGREAVTTLVSVALDAGPSEGVVIASGHDFYSTPRFSPDGTQLSWLAWNHPQMPWDGTELWLATVASDGTLTDARRIAGHAREAIFQPGWGPGGTLYFVSDRSGWWNLYRVRHDDVEAMRVEAVRIEPVRVAAVRVESERVEAVRAEAVSVEPLRVETERIEAAPVEPVRVEAERIEPLRAEPVCAMEVDFGRPQWGFGMSTWACAGPSRLVVTYQQRGRWRLATIDESSGVLTPLSDDIDDIDDIEPG